MRYLPGKQYIFDKYADGTLVCSVYHNLYIAEKGSAGRVDAATLYKLAKFQNAPRAPNFYNVSIESVIFNRLNVTDNSKHEQFLFNPAKRLLMPKRVKLDLDVPAVVNFDSPQNSIARTRKNIYAYAHNMEINVFGTFTFSSKYVDRTDISEIKKITGEWFHNLRKKYPEYSERITYLLIPEIHKKNIDIYGRCWHMHYIGWLPEEIFQFSGVRQKGRKVYNIPSWKYGFTNFTFTDSPEKVSNYILKYITKELCEMTPGKQRYLVSNNVKKTERVFHQFIDKMQDDREEVDAQDLETVIKMFGNYKFTFENEYDLDIYGIETKLQRFIFKETENN